MDKKEIEHKLEQAKTDRDLAIMEANKEIERLKAQLAEAEKPKLRHGDCGIDGDGHKFACFESHKNLFDMDVRYASKLDETGKTLTFNRDSGYEDELKVYFNAYDEIEAQSEPLEEFEVTSKKCNGKIVARLYSTDSKGVSQPFGTTSDHTAYFESRDGHFLPDELHEIILKLRRMEATAKSK